MTTDQPGRVPERLRDQLRGLRATGDNDVAAGALEDDDPLAHRGALIQPPDPGGGPGE